MFLLVAAVAVVGFVVAAAAGAVGVGEVKVAAWDGQEVAEEEEVEIRDLAGVEMDVVVAVECVASVE